jgi:hypothetical protein
MNGLMLWIINLIDPIIERPIVFGLMGGIGLFFWLSFQKREHEILAGISAFIMAVGIFWFGLWFLVTWFTPYNLQNPVYLWGGMFIIGFILAVFAERKAIPMIESFFKTGTKKSVLERDTKTDIRKIFQELSKIPEYDPLKYIKKDWWFFGLNKQGKPIYFKDRLLKHLQITGMSGAGKSLMLALLTFQSIFKKQCTIIIDSKKKGDLYYPEVCKKACDEVGTKFHFVDLMAPVEQLNIVEDATPDEIANALIAVFCLDDTPDGAGFYRGKDRKMARFLSKNIKQDETLADFSREHDKYFRSKECEASGFADHLEEVSEVKAINASRGISLREIIENGECLYVAGAYSDPKYVKAQRLFLARIVQLIERRDNIFSEPNQVCVVLDEFSFQISRIFADSLKLIRGFGANFILAHQSLSDLRDTPTNMNPEVFYNSVMTNCKLKFTYQCADVETAEYFADLSGEILVDDEIRHVDKTLSLTEKFSDSRQVRQTETNLVDKNTLLSLPEKTGVFLGAGLAEIVAVHPIKVTPNQETRKIQDFSNIEKIIENKSLIFEDLR